MTILHIHSDIKEDKIWEKFLLALKKCNYLAIATNRAEKRENVCNLEVGKLSENETSALDLSGWLRSQQKKRGWWAGEGTV